MDIQASVGLGIRRRLYSVDCSIRVWFLQHYVNFHHSRLYYNASLQASFVVRLLSYGNNDAVNLQSKKQIVKNNKGYQKNNKQYKTAESLQKRFRRCFYFLLFAILLICVYCCYTSVFFCRFGSLFCSDFSEGRYFLRYSPVYDFSHSAICSGVPQATTVPPPSPPSGPRSTI